METVLVTDEEWKTHDTALATFLVMKGKTMLSLEWQDTRDNRGNARATCYFVFDYCEEVEQLANMFYAGKALVDPLAFNSVYAKLVHQMKASNLPPAFRRR